MISTFDYSKILLKGCVNMREYNGWTFQKWISNFTNVELPIGDLARDIVNDKDFPGGDYFEEILEHILNKSRNQLHIVETFCVAWNYYLASK